MEGYYDGVAAFLDHAVRERFLPLGTRELLMIDTEPGALVERLRACAARL